MSDEGRRRTGLGFIGGPGGGIAALPTGSIVLLVLYDFSMESELKLNIPIPDICIEGIGAATDVGGDAVKHESDAILSPSLVV